MIISGVSRVSRIFLHTGDYAVINQVGPLFLVRLIILQGCDGGSPIVPSLFCYISLLNLNYSIAIIYLIPNNNITRKFLEQ